MDDAEEENQCRICLGEETSVENRLFSPCLCRGSQRYIHEQCLQQWRQSHLNQSLYRCATCLYHYRTSRMMFARYLQNPFVITGCTVVVTVSTVWIIGLFLKSLLFIFGLGLAASVRSSVMAVSRKLVWWSVILIGIVTLVVTLFQSVEENAADGPIVDRHTWSFIINVLDETINNTTNSLTLLGYVIPLSGFGLFMVRVYKKTRTLIGQLLQHIGDRVLEI